MDFPSWWQTYILSAIGYQVVDPGNPGSLLDRVYLDTGVISDSIWKSTPWGLHSIYIALQLFGARLVCIATLCALFITQAVLSFLAMIALMLGPLCIPFLMFTYTRGLFGGWVWATWSLLFSKFAVDIVIGMFAGVMAKLISAVSITGTPNTDLVGFWGCAIVMALMGFSVRYVPMLVQSITTRGTVAMNSVAHHMSAGPMRNAVTSGASIAAGAPTRGLAKGVL